MKILCLAIIAWLALESALQAQGRRLGENMPQTVTDPSPEYMAIFEEARTLAAQSKYDEAERQLQLVLSKYPHHQASVKLMSYIRTARERDPSVAVRRKLSSIEIPRVNFRDALVENAIEFVRQELRRLDPEKKGVNIVVNLPSEVKQRTVTLDLIDVSAAEVLKYMAEVGGFVYRVDRSVVFITTKEPVVAQFAAPSEPEYAPIPGAAP